MLERYIDSALQSEEKCPFGGDVENDCDGCACSGDYHFASSKCVRREPDISEQKLDEK